MKDDIAREGDFGADNEPDGDVMRTSDGHYYEMGERHDCGHPDCPANVPSDQENVSEFRSKEDFPQETADQWDNIRSGNPLLVDESGSPVDDIHDAYYLLRPVSVGGPGLPPVGVMPVGEPKNPDLYDTWLDPNTKRVMIWEGKE